MDAAILASLQTETLVKLLASAIIGGVIGLERHKSKDIGPRTYALIALGATLFTVIAVSMSTLPGTDPTRIISQIIVGIGFVGAGLIWKEGGGLHGLTTAASVWAVAAIGVTVGLGMWEITFYTTAITVLVLLSKRYAPWL